MYGHSKINLPAYRSFSSIAYHYFFDSHSFFFLSYSARLYACLAGWPITTVSGRTSFVTTAAIATTLFLPTRIPGLKTDLPPIMAPSSTITPAILGLIGYGSFVNAAEGPMKTFLPITVRGGM